MEFDESPPRIASEVVNKNYRITKQADIDSYEIKPTKRGSREEFCTLNQLYFLF